ncbi:MAG: T9SS type A sorting domain-containing protein, partial [Saprospiraceae bacterium]|nr:T9SS type A sorting domain-containing protein [Saprospiraceae bacterium]
TGFGISPNPTSDNLHVELPNYECENRNLLLFNNLGQSMLQLKMPYNEVHTDLDLSQFPMGLYLIAIMENGKLAYKQQVVVSRN